MRPMWWRVTALRPGSVSVHSSSGEGNPGLPPRLCGRAPSRAQCLPPTVLHCDVREAVLFSARVSLVRRIRGLQGLHRPPPPCARAQRAESASATLTVIRDPLLTIGARLAHHPPQPTKVKPLAQRGAQLETPQQTELHDGLHVSPRWTLQFGWPLSFQSWGVALKPRLQVPSRSALSRHPSSIRSCAGQILPIRGSTAATLLCVSFGAPKHCAESRTWVERKPPSRPSPLAGGRGRAIGGAPRARAREGAARGRA